MLGFRFKFSLHPVCISVTVVRQVIELGFFNRKKCFHFPDEACRALSPDSFVALPVACDVAVRRSPRPRASLPVPWFKLTLGIRRSPLPVAGNVGRLQV